MAESKPAEGLIFDKVVYDCLVSSCGRGSGENMAMVDAKKETGLSEDSILRAIAEIRAKGYPVISQKMRPMAEDRFRMAQTEREYLDLREGLISGIHGLISLLRVCDAGAKAKFGVVAHQARFDI